MTHVCGPYVLDMLAGSNSTKHVVNVFCTFSAKNVKLFPVTKDTFLKGNDRVTIKTTSSRWKINSPHWCVGHMSACPFCVEPTQMCWLTNNEQNYKNGVILCDSNMLVFLI